MQCIALLDLACGNCETELQRTFQGVRLLVHEIAEQVTMMSRQPNSLSIQSMVSDEDAHEEPGEETTTKGGPDRVMSTGFSAVLGCEDAKAALFENIILPLRCGSNSNQSIFTGIEV